MYYVGETLIGFDRDICFFDTLEQATAEFNDIMMDFIHDRHRRLALMQEYGMDFDAERWIIKNTTTNDVVAEKTFILHKNGNIYIQ